MSGARSRVVALAVAVVVAMSSIGSPAAGVDAVRVEPDFPVTATDARSELAQNSPTVAVDPRDSRFAAIASRVDGRQFSCALHVSGDGGRTWVLSKPFPLLPEGADRCYAPEIAFDRNGVLHYLFIGLQGAGNAPMGAFLSSSVDRGPFSAPRRVLGPDRFMVRMAVDPTVGDQGRIHLVWVEAAEPPPLGGFAPVPNPILAAHSDDGGRSWSVPVAVSDPKRQRVAGPSIAIGPNGSVHVAYYDLLEDRRDYQGLEGPVWEGIWSLAVATSTNGGRTFARHVEAVAGIRPIERVMLIFTMPAAAIAADRNGGVWVAWPDARSGDWDVLAAASTDGGQMFAAPVRINDDPRGNGRNQYLPRLSSPSDGAVTAIFYDRRDDPRNLSNHVYFTSSRDGGRTFAPNTQVTSEASFSRTGVGYPLPSAQGLIEFGSRLGLATTPTGVLAAWTDTRNVRFGNTHQDVFATLIVTRQEASTSPIAPALVATAALALVAVVFAGRRARGLRNEPRPGPLGILMARGRSPARPRRRTRIGSTDPAVDQRTDER